MASRIRQNKPIEGVTAIDINVGVIEIIDAAKESIASGKAVKHEVRRARGSDVVVQRELVGMRAQTDRVGLVLALVVDEGLDQFFGEDVALQQELRDRLRGSSALLRAMPAWTARTSSLPATDRRCPCRAARRDRSCSARRRGPPSASRRTPDTDWPTDRADGTRRAWPWDWPSTSECGTAAERLRREYARFTGAS